MVTVFKMVGTGKVAKKIVKNDFPFAVFRIDGDYMNRFDSFTNASTAIEGWKKRGGDYFIVDLSALNGQEIE